MSRLLTCSLLLVAACGGKKPAPATPTPEIAAAPAAAPAPAATRAPSEADHAATASLDAELANLPPAVATFHDAFAPRWHAPRGPQRTEATCVALPALREDVRSLIVGAPPSHADAQAWNTSTLQLVASLEHLDAACAARDTAAFEAAFGKAHDAFDALLATCGVHVDRRQELHEQAALERDLLEAEHDRAELSDERAPATRDALDPDDDGDGAGK